MRDKLQVFLEHSSFVLTAYRDDTRECLDYQNVICQSCKICIQCGKLFGVYHLESLETVACYFFFIDKDDYFLQEYMEINCIDRENIEARIPESDKLGLFRKKDSVDDFTDEYIMDVLVWTYSSESQNCGHFFVNRFFDRISDRIRMRTFFKRFYFRSFRKAFAPHGNGAKRDLLSFKEIF